MASNYDIKFEHGCAIVTGELSLDEATAILEEFGSKNEDWVTDNRLATHLNAKLVMGDVADTRALREKHGLDD